MGSYLWGKAADSGLWHALLVHDPEYITEQVKSASLSGQKARQLGVSPDSDAAAVYSTRVVETRPGTAQTLCGLGKERTQTDGAGRVRTFSNEGASGDALEKGSGVIVRRKGIPITEIGVDPDKSDSLCPACETKIAPA